jgi:hypothetical protein
MHAYRGAAAPGPLVVDAYRDDGAFFVVVCDEGTGLNPRTDSPGLGLGLGLIGRLAQRLEISTSDPVGARVTMVFAAPRRRTATTTLGAAQREWIRRQGRISRAIEAAQRRRSGRLSRPNPRALA